MEAEGPRTRIPEESTSNMTTPLAQPLPDSPDDSWTSSDSQIPSLLENAVDLDPLPPSVLSSHNGWGMSGPDGSRVSCLPQDQFVSSHDTHPLGEPVPGLLRQPFESSPDSDQRSAPRAIAGRADWRLRGRPDHLVKPPRMTTTKNWKTSEPRSGTLNNILRSP
jgi:hypothetical protein